MAKSQPENATELQKPTTKGRRTRGKEEFPKTTEFFARLQKIDRKDWGTRACLKLYRIEPVINMLSTQDHKFVTIYGEDGWQVNEERIKQDFGSGKYKLYLNFKAPTDQEKEVDSVVLDILDMRYPPVIAAGNWVDHPKNKNWLWAKDKLPQTHPQQQQQQASALNDMANVLGVVNDIQDSAIERAKANNPAPEKQPDLLATATGLITAISNIMPKPQPQTENKMLETITALYTEQAKEMRQEIREMRQQATAKPSGLTTFKEILTEVKTFLPEIKDMFPVAETVRRGPWYTGILERLSEGAAQLIPTVGAQLYSNWTANRNGTPALQPGNPLPNAAPITAGAPTGLNGAPPNQQPRGTPMIDLDQMLISVLNNDGNGGDLAYGLTTFFGEPGQLAYRQACQAGEAALLQLLKTRPVWNQLGPLQEKMPKFVHEFINWGNDEEPVKPASAETLEVLEPEVI